MRIIKYALSFAAFIIIIFGAKSALALDETGFYDCGNTADSCPKDYQCESLTGYEKVVDSCPKGGTCGSLGNKTIKLTTKCASTISRCTENYNPCSQGAPGSTCLLEKDPKTKKYTKYGKCIVQPFKDHRAQYEYEESDDKKDEKEGQSCGKAFLKDDKKEDKPSCEPLYESSAKSKICVFTGTRGLSLESKTAENFETLTDSMKPNQSSMFEGKFKNGSAFKVGIMKKPDGSFEFTKDGVHYSNNLKNAIKPGFFIKVGNGLQNIKETIGGWWGSDKYTGRDTAGEDGKTAQLEGQNRLDAANIALKNLTGRKGIEEQVKTGKQAFDKWIGGTKKILEGKNADVILGELKVATGCDLPLLKKILSGDVVGAVINKDAILKQLYAFPAQSVVTLARELRSANFANSVHLYIKERADKAPEKIYELMTGGELPELDLVTNIKGLNQQYAPPLLFNAYEEAYQRYLLTKELRTSL